ncbi:Histidine-containing phosphotransfer protein 1 [Morella rubra]|uniref:Histidine-containing phosphotransfer protein n=1 Tax=Morella rubra TaxID=262757 RepID=A0A6A1UQ68_9ROSI|nr:Histidine-containing phosphotransfer protein 1 [Morella rubra]KAB1202333.1 Histidine-containing phosphotransfer protein 1 [Morella rubra]
MDYVTQLQKQLVDYTASLFHEKFLDEQFNQLQQLQDESNPDFVVEVVSLFFEDSERLLNELGKVLEQQIIDYRKVDAHVHQLKGSSSRFSLGTRFFHGSIGAQRVQSVCITFRNYCEEKNIEGCLKCLQQVKHEYSLVKSKLDTLFKLEKQLVAAGGSIPTYVV